MKLHYGNMERSTFMSVGVGILLTCVLLIVVWLVSACHALVIADHLTYEGTFGKGTSSVVTVTDSLTLIDSSNYE